MTATSFIYIIGSQCPRVLVKIGACDLKLRRGPLSD